MKARAEVRESASSHLSEVTGEGTGEVNIKGAGTLVQVWSPRRSTVIFNS